jgi:hypothetical protein
MTGLVGKKSSGQVRLVPGPPGAGPGGQLRGDGLDRLGGLGQVAVVELGRHGQGDDGPDGVGQPPARIARWRTGAQGVAHRRW